MADPILTRTAGTPCWDRGATIADYGSATDKQDHPVEGRSPAAWVWYQELEDSLGDAFTTNRTGLVHARKLALARNLAAVGNARERSGNNALPSTSHELLWLWAQYLGVPVRVDDTDSDVRLRCAAHFRAAVGPTRPNTDEAIAELLGPAFVRTWRVNGATLNSPPAQTFWDGVNTGPAAYDLGGGAWLSERSHVTVETVQPTGMSDSRFLYLMNVELWQLLDRMLPAYVTFNWAINVSDGFLLDVSRMDWDGFGY